MRKYGFDRTRMIAGIVLVVGLLWIGSLAACEPNPGRPRSHLRRHPLARRRLTDEGAAVGNTSARGLWRRVAPPVNPDSLSRFCPTHPISGETLVYFVPTDNDATATVLYLYNTDDVARMELHCEGSVTILVYLNINVGATSFLCLASTPSLQRRRQAGRLTPVITNFTRLHLFRQSFAAQGVKAEGHIPYIRTGTVDPRGTGSAVPLRFSTDPANLFIPSVKSGR